MVVHDIEGLAQIDAEEPSPDGRFPLVEASDHVRGQGEQGSDGGVAGLEAMLGWRRSKRRASDRKIETFQDIDFRT